MIMTGIARLGRDAEVKFTSDNTPVANLSLAYNYGQKDNEGKRPTQWVSAALWGKRAESAAPYLKKGTLISVVVEDVFIDTFEKKDGSQGSGLKGRVTSFEFAGGKREDKDEPEPARTKPAETTPPAAAKKSGGNFDDMDDDIPF